jgi:hypothetical protein
MMRVRGLAVVALLLVSVSSGAWAAGEAGKAVDLELVLAVDASGSITTGALEFQLRGHAAAFRDPQVADALTVGGNKAIAVTLVAGSGFTAPRRVIDICSNGFSNAGVDVSGARDRAVRQGVTINALAILDEYDWLEEYYVESVIGGPFAFVRTAESRESFADAILHKLVEEIAGVPGGGGEGKKMAAAR